MAQWAGHGSVNCPALSDGLLLMPDPRPRFFDRSFLWLGASIVLPTMLLAIWFVGFVTATGDRLEHDRILALARTVTATLESERIETLRGAASDVGTDNFRVVRDELRQAREVNPDFRFVYLMRPAPDGSKSMAFLADAELPESPDYSAPGDLYDGPDEDLWAAWDSGVARVQPPHQDDWGHWVTAVAPVRDHEGRVQAILGMDMRADSWNATLARYRAFALAICALVLMLEGLFLFGLRLEKKNKRRLARLNARLARQLDELQRAQGRLQLADVVVQHTGEAIVVLDAQLRVISANPGFDRITGFDGAQVVGSVLPLFGPDDADALQQIRSRVQQSPHWDGTLWAHRADGGLFPMEASVDVVRDASGQVHQYIMLFRDVTVQKRLEDRLRELATTDGLTLLANRRAFDEALEQSWHRAIRKGEPMSLLMIDIDHFKPYNDLYGHPAGDRCLQQVADALSAAVTQKDALVARYGGEEFAVILPSADKDEAIALAEALRQQIEALDIPHRGSPGAGRITASIGISTRTPPHISDVGELTHGADQALYRAKQHGRNSVEVDGQETRCR